MARIRAVDGSPPRAVEGPWYLVSTPPGLCATPGDLDMDRQGIPASVPGTAASTLRAAGLWSEDEPAPLHCLDIWYLARVSGCCRERLRFEGLATLAEVWLDGTLVLCSRSMFVAAEVDVDLTGSSVLAICFRSLATELARPHPRGRWRPRLATPGALRNIRTSLLGFMPGWCPPIDAIGPYRPVIRTPLAAFAARPTSVDLKATFLDGVGRLSVRLCFEAAQDGAASLHCDSREGALAETAPGLLEGELTLPGIAPWWPHTHGEPRLHGVEVRVGDHRIDLGRVGFRTIGLTRPFAEGLGLAVNGFPVFCRGACWTPPDLIGLSGDAESCRSLLVLAQEAGMNMLRLPGVTLYEADAFYELCDDLGIMVWQDLMLANFDYPTDDPTFCGQLVREVEGFLDRTQASPSLCVVSGGSEVWQQAAMLGLPRASWTGGFVAGMLSDIAARMRPDIVVVPNSPCGGDLPFSTTAGVAHYFGVGAYRRRLDDARRAEIGFASECLAFANVPEPASLCQAGLSDPASPRWAATIPRDRGVDWTFEEVRDHYVAALFDCDPESLRTEDPERYLTLGRAAVAEVMERTFGEWRRTRSPTAGGLVWFLRDLAPGAGWGVVDVEGRPKSAWYALKRAFRPIQVHMSDEGLNGLHVHVHNERATEIEADLRLTFVDALGRTVAHAERHVVLPPHSSQLWSSAELLGRFFDATGAYLFGPPTHRLACASLVTPCAGTIAESIHFLSDHLPASHGTELRPVGIQAELSQGGSGWSLRIVTERLALGVHIVCDGNARPSDDWFHLAPGFERHLSLFGAGESPSGTVQVINGSDSVRFEIRDR